MKRILVSCLLCIILGLPGVVLSDAHGDNASVSVYGRLWPKVTYTSPSNGDPSTDITDAISRLGVSADYKLSDTLTASCPGGSARQPGPGWGRSEPK